MKRDKTMRWIVRYHCGCTENAERKRDLLNYCVKHGGDAVEWINTETARFKRIEIKLPRRANDAR